MASISPSTEAPSRRAARLAFGGALALLFTQLFPWKLSYVCPLVCVMLLQEAKPLSLRLGAQILGWAALWLFGANVLYQLLTPMPALLLLAAAGGLLVLFRWTLTSGVHLLAVVAGVLSTTVMPIMAVLEPSFGWLSGAAMWLNFLMAMLFAWLAFTVIPVKLRGAVSHGQTQSLSVEVQRQAANTMTLTLLPLVWFAVMSGLTNILIPIFAAFFAMELGSAGSYQQGKKMLIANLVMGGGGTVLFYELMVIFPHPVALALAAAFVLLFWARRIFYPGPTADYWSSGLNGFVVLIGSALYYEDVSTVGDLIKRLSQIFLAALYVWLMYRVVEMGRYYRHCLTASRDG